MQQYKRSTRHLAPRTKYINQHTFHRLRNDLYCVEWDVKLYYIIPYQHTFQTLIQVRLDLTEKNFQELLVQDLLHLFCHPNNSTRTKTCILATIN